jgi:hypothetical protein
MSLLPLYDDFKITNYQKINEKKVRIETLRKKLLPKEKNFEDVYKLKSLLRTEDVTVAIHKLYNIEHLETKKEYTLNLMIGPQKRLLSKIYEVNLEFEIKTRFWSF